MDFSGRHSYSFSSIDRENKQAGVSLPSLSLLLTSSTTSLRPLSSIDLADLMSIPECAAQSFVMNRLSNTITLYRNNGKYLTGGPRPLLLMLPWLGAKPHAIERYRQTYYPYGFDILDVETSILHFLWPRCGLSYALQVVDLLQREPFASCPIIIHAFSIGGFLFAKMITASRNIPWHSSFKARVIGQIFDSLVIGNADRMAKGVSQMLAPPFLQPILKRITLFWLLRGYITSYHKTAIKSFWDHMCPAPILVFSSKNDPLSDSMELEALLQSWRKKGIPVTEKSWDISRHAGHLRQHPQEYQNTLKNFLNSLGPFCLPSRL
ncbi:transmembrane protein 53-A [Pristis pectinata]|uniref:transmembrane protein 53-A n=1 Tax=Pristis pectinata TaxID=685728 RepID=UPI00223D4707|nr:transmembrane protein 53-A [Pristis pectinata]